MIKRSFFFKDKKAHYTAPQEVSVKFRRFVQVEFFSGRFQKDKLKECAQPYGEITTSASADLEQIRSLINKLQENNQVRPLREFNDLR